MIYYYEFGFGHGRKRNNVKKTWYMNTHVNKKRNKESEHAIIISENYLITV